MGRYNLLINLSTVVKPPLHSKYSISGTALEWFRSYLTNRSQFDLIDGCRSQSRELKCGVPQVSVLGPILYVLYTAPLADILRFHEMQFHFYADDTWLYISTSTNNEMELTNSITLIEECLSDINKWMFFNRLKLNKDKTQLLYLFPNIIHDNPYPLFSLELTWSSPLHMQEILALSSIRYHYVNASPCKQCLYICILSSLHHFAHKEILINANYWDSYSRLWNFQSGSLQFFTI